jgi:hypothetical protein
MTKDDIMKLARKAGLYTHKDVQPEILAFANLVAAAKAEVALAEAYRCGCEAGAAAEREAIAKMFEASPELVRLAQNDHGGCIICGLNPKTEAKAIRARGTP